MAFGYLVVALVAAAVAVFALQNGEPTSVRFIVWTIDGFPLAGLILISLASGLVVAGVPLMIQRWRLRARLRAAEWRVAELQATSAPGAPSGPRGPGGPSARA